MLRVAATQMHCTSDTMDNIKRAEGLVRKAAAEGAKIILIQELFENLYFCQEEIYDFFSMAAPEEEDPAIKYFRPIAKELEVVLPISFFEKKNNAYYNSIVVIDADGEIIGKYRKNHIPDGPGYKEKFYFTPGDLGFQVFKTKYGSVGIGICWDQWLPETARALTLMGADIILYPTAIGSEPNMAHDSMPHWQRTMQGHSAANLIPVVASNRIGREDIGNTHITFYGSSFITDHFGEKIAELDREAEDILVADVDIEQSQKMRASWGIFRDRRPDAYGVLLTKDGSNRCC